MDRHGLLIDITKCVGCGQCHDACAQANGNPSTSAETLSDQSWTAVCDKGNGVFVRRLCMHCAEPACASVCPVAALHKTPEGPVLYDESRCMGCRYCMVACPHQIPKYEWKSRVPRVRKCIMCAPRLSQGKPTACAEVCPTGATKFGDPDALADEARGRIAGDPNTYGSRIFGLKEAGGASVLFLAPKGGDFAALGFAGNLPDEPLPELTYRVLSKIPNFAVVGAAALFGIHWIIGRRMELAREEALAAATERGTRAASGMPLAWMEKFLMMPKDMAGKQREGEDESCSTIHPLV